MVVATNAVSLPASARTVLNATPAAGPVMAYFADGLLRDPTGILPAYRAPRGYRGGAGIAGLDERQMREGGYLT